MAKQQPQCPGSNLSATQQASVVLLGRMLGDVRDEFDREVEAELAALNSAKNAEKSH